MIQAFALKFAIVSVLLVVFSNCQQSDSTITSQCECGNYAKTYPELITAPQTRLSCGYFPVVNDIRLFNISIQGDRLEAFAEGLGDFAAEKKRCGDDGQWKCMTIEIHPKPDRIDGVYFYANADYERSKSCPTATTCTFALDPATLPYVAVYYCTKEHAVPGKYIEIRTADLTEAQFQDIELEYEMVIDRQALQDCIKRRDSLLSPAAA